MWTQKITEGKICAWKWLIVISHCGKKHNERKFPGGPGLRTLLGFSLNWRTKILHVPQCSQKQNKTSWSGKKQWGEVLVPGWHLDTVLGSKAKLLQMGCSQAVLVTFNNHFCGERVGRGALVCNHCQFLWCKCFSSGLIWSH